MRRYFVSLVGLLVCVLASPAGGKIELVVGAEQGLVAPFGVDFTSNGTMYIVEMAKGERLKRFVNGKLETVAGTGEKGNAGDGQPGERATFNGMHSLAIYTDDRIYLADTWNHRVRRFDPMTKTLAAFAGTGTRGFSGDGGPALQAQFTGIYCIAFDAKRERLIATDLENRRIRAVDLVSGSVVTIAGNGKKGVPADGGKAIDQPLVDPRAAVMDSLGNLYILDRGGHALRRVAPDGTIQTVAGTGRASSTGVPGPAKSASLNGPKHLCVDRDGSVIIADTENHRIVRFLPESGEFRPVAGSGKKGAGGLGGDPSAVELNQPHGVTVHPKTGELYITDSSNNRILVLRN
jgi:sugar lactone lactonase YvrE